MPVAEECPPIIADFLAFSKRYAVVSLSTHKSTHNHLRDASRRSFSHASRGAIIFADPVGKLNVLVVYCTRCSARTLCAG
jgi:hypothetical protein